MKIGFLSMCIMLVAFYNADCSVYSARKASGIIPLPYVAIKHVKKNETKVLKIDHQNQKKSPEAIVSKSLLDGRSFAEVVKGVIIPKVTKKLDKSATKTESEKIQNKNSQPKMNYKKNTYDDRNAKQRAINRFNKKWQSSKIGVSKRRQSAHRGNLFNAR